MATKVVSIEAGKRICKICVTEKKGKSYAVTDSFIFSTPDGTVIDGAIMDPIVLGEKVKVELRNRGIAATNCVFSVNSSKVASRDVDLPVAKDDQIKSVVATNAGEYFPVDISKYAVSHSVISRTKTDSHVLVVAVPQLVVEGYTNLAEVTGLVCESIDFSVNSQYQVLKGVPGEDVTMYVNIDPDSTMVTFIGGGELLLQRSIMTGGDEMICSYMAAKGMENEEYVNALETLSTDELPDNSRNYDDSLGRVAGVITRALDFFHTSKHADKEIGKVVLMGSCCHLNGLKNKVAETLGKEVLYLEEVPELAGLANSTNGISVYINCLGARLAPLSFLPKDYLDRTGQGKKKGGITEIYGFVVFGAALLIAIVLCATQLIPYLSNKKELKSVEAGIVEYQHAEDEYNAYVTYTKGDEALQGFVDNSVNYNAELLDFLLELEAKMPSSIVFLSANCDAEGVNLNVTVPDFAEAAVTLRQLRSFDSIDVLSVSPMTKSGDSGATLVSFTLSCRYPKPVEETTAALEETTAATEEV